MDKELIIRLNNWAKELDGNSPAGLTADLRAAADRLTELSVREPYKEGVHPIGHPIEDLDLTVRTYNCIRRAGIRTIEGLLELDAYRLSRIRNMSSRCIQEVLKSSRPLAMTAPIWKMTAVASSDRNKLKFKEVFLMANMMNLVPGEWENYADETEHYCYVRCLDLGKMYEAVCVRHINGTDDANYLHQVFFPEEWCEEALVELLQRFEYENLDDFVQDINLADSEKGFIRNADGTIDRNASPAWYIDWMYMVNLMAEDAVYGSRRVPAKEADKLAADATGLPLADEEG